MQGNGKTSFIAQNLGWALDGNVAKNWSNLTCTKITSTAMYKTKMQDLVKELLCKGAEDEQK